MKKADLSKWKISQDTEGLLYFGSLVNELLFDYTIDTFKIPALNSRTICLELMHTINEIEKGSLREANIVPIIQELCSSMKKDLVIKEVLKQHFTSFIEELIKKQELLSEVKILISYLINKLENNYFETCKQILRDKIKIGRDKEDITRLTRIYINELLFAGYSPTHIYFENDRFFFTGKYPRIIDSPNLINEYFDCFKIINKEYNVLFRVSKNFEYIDKVIGKIDFTITGSAPTFKFHKESVRVNEILATSPKFPYYLTIKNIKAPDSSMAREIAESNITMIDSLFKYHIHRKYLSWGADALVYFEDQSYFSVCKVAIPPTLKGPEERLEELNVSMDETLSALTNNKLGEHSRDRLTIALELHRMAIVSPTSTNKLLNFWAAVEVLFPPKEKGGKTRIEQIVENLTPFITKAYVAKLSHYLLTSIENCGEEKAMEIIKQIDYGDNMIDKCTALFSIKQNESIRDQLYSLFKNHPLLMNRIYYLHKKFHSAENILENLKAHSERISWHIMRIYRTRNLIIHTGESLPYLDILVENLHSYLDRALELILKAILNAKKDINIEEIILEIKLSYYEHLSLLGSAKTQDCNKDNYKLLLYGN